MSELTVLTGYGWVKWNTWLKLVRCLANPQNILTWSHVDRKLLLGVDDPPSLINGEAWPHVGKQARVLRAYVPQGVSSNPPPPRDWKPGPHHALRLAGFEGEIVEIRDHVPSVIRIAGGEDLEVYDWKNVTPAVPA